MESGLKVPSFKFFIHSYELSENRNTLYYELYEPEGQVRRGAAERGAVELKKNEFQGEIQRQKEQISHIENVYKRQLEGAQSTCIQEKATLQQNISSSTKTIQELKGQLNQLNDDLGKLQKELQSCQGNINTLNNKLTYDMTHCHSQVLSQKELCDERMAAAKLEFEKKMEKLVPPPGVSSQQENAVDGAVKDSKPVQIVPSGVQPATAVSHTPGLSECLMLCFCSFVYRHLSLFPEATHRVSLKIKGYGFSLSVVPVGSEGESEEESLPPRLKSAQNELKSTSENAKAAISKCTTLQELIGWLLRSHDQIAEQVKGAAETYPEQGRLKENLEENMREVKRAKELSQEYRQQAQDVLSEAAHIAGAQL
uniref:Uncharacterized protein n=1 Tax=Acanthochromis polyacanthus TaxID=80966 RepID=A0A3Q1G0R3_9TELE